ncbi:hypothetical protein DVH05_012713 [Phytophthora capsici]|nr:hypothetical protein DVH05_012775 [Phytophthora capsici]KAG1683910.1 hypothetical protein DVH05_012713 [Phytophthora capsici]
MNVADLKKKDTDLKMKNTDLKMKDTDLKMKDAIIEQKDAIIEEKDTDLRQKDATIAHKGAIIDQKDSKLREERIRYLKEVSKTLRAWGCALFGKNTLYPKPVGRIVETIDQRHHPHVQIAPAGDDLDGRASLRVRDGHPGEHKRNHEYQSRYRLSAGSGGTSG